ncbi:hypothetical protein, partial [Dietzia sp. SYD-A1]|uniref:hypothetical protein n=1 Tax=Dietzia sp. SYD-A1 TaxID=2780141 RepID=UPI00189192F1
MVVASTAAAAIKTSAPLAPTHHTENATTATSLKEGTDYSFTAHVDGHPVRWSCEKPTTIALAGDVPTGTSAALQDAVTELRSVSGLPLEILSPDQNADITVHYAPHGTTHAGAELSDTDRLGVGQIRYDPTTGLLTHGLVLIRANTPHTDPTIPTGKAVLTHELLHTLGIGHAHQGTDEIMTPTVVPGRPPT